MKFPGRSCVLINKLEIIEETTVTPATCALALSLFIVAGCAGVERAPASGPAPDRAAIPELPPAQVAQAPAAPEPQEGRVETSVVAEAPAAAEPAAAEPVVTSPVQTAPAAASPAQTERPVPAPSAAAKPAPAKPAAAPAKPATAAKAPAPRPAPSASTGSGTPGTTAGTSSGSSTAGTSAGSTAASAPPAEGNAAPKAAGPQLNLTALEQKLRETNAIGLMTKMTLKNQVDELVERFKAYHEGRDHTPLTQLRQPYDSLILKVLSLLQDKDPSLATLIAQSREAIWGVLTDRNRFSSL
jgi:hypothetical protein